MPDYPPFNRWETTRKMSSFEILEYMRRILRLPVYSTGALATVLTIISCFLPHGPEETVLLAYALMFLLPGAAIELAICVILRPVMDDVKLIERLRERDAQEDALAEATDK